MLQQFGMGLALLQEPQMIFYILAVEVLILCILQVRTNRLLLKNMRTKESKKERIKQLKEEVKNGESDIPVMKFESGKTGQKKKEDAKTTSKEEPTSGFDQKELAVLQEMLAEYFG